MRDIFLNCETSITQCKISPRQLLLTVVWTKAYDGVLTYIKLHNIGESRMGMFLYINIDYKYVFLNLPKGCSKSFSYYFYRVIQSIDEFQLSINFWLTKITSSYNIFVSSITGWMMSNLPEQWVTISFLSMFTENWKGNATKIWIPTILKKCVECSN